MPQEGVSGEHHPRAQACTRVRAGNITLKSEGMCFFTKVVGAPLRKPQWHQQVVERTKCFGSRATSALPPGTTLCPKRRRKQRHNFLPFVCDGCSGIFCLQHRSRDAHGCSEVNIRNSSVKPDQHRSYPCSYKDCNGKELLPVLCPYCDKHFCLRHRHQSDHECEKLDTPKPRMAATQQLVQHIIDSKKSDKVKSKKRKGAKNSETAAKVALMKLKMHACGDKSLPQTERIYFQVFLPKGNKEKSKPMFFCSKWSIGKVVDFAASLASLKNDNNKSTSQKLRLCHTASGEALPFEHTLETWLSDKDYPLYNGGNIILEYLDNDVLFIEDTESYFS
ncbi:AN1-type zinc finger protein 1 [Geospiza fortis]|uniref:AN1-type zinc finger protein 1 n=1 Tax=Geospiza fortis TaxID=48883 RepID=A0A6I9ZAD5_GEOFO|nr:AN1-type zinc finger protein 1 [Geospiza fortis]